VAAAIERVEAQQAAIAQAQEQLSYSKLKSPITGVITQRLTEEGNLVQPNGEVVRIGDFSRVQVNVEVSELALAKIQLGQSVSVRLDAFGDRAFKGQVSRISPAADQTARLVPIEVMIPNNNRQIGSGLLARVSFDRGATQQVIVPESAVLEPGNKGAGGSGGYKTGGSGGAEGDKVVQNPNSKLQNQQATIYVVTEVEGNQATVAARTVKLGERADGRVEILSGLKPGEQFVARSGRPLKSGETVGLSIVSETAQQQGQK
jgi:multidrug efflux pump subunit AcrA (membrane-fusion protein)